MIDIHSHILPYVDDGAVDMEMSLNMARQYIKNGIHNVIATPHFIESIGETDRDSIDRVCTNLREELLKENIPLNIFLGNEIYTSIDFLKAIDNKEAITLNNSSYILIELPMHDIPMFFDDIIYESQIKGFIPILAHPERNRKIIENPNILFNYIEKGILTQLNLPSLEGRYGEASRKTAIKLLQSNMVYFVGTDAHTDGLRSPNVYNSLKILKNLISEEYFNLTTEINPKLLLEDKEISAIEPLSIKMNKGFIDIFKEGLLKRKIS